MTAINLLCNERPLLHNGALRELVWGKNVSLLNMTRCSHNETYLIG